MTGSANVRSVAAITAAKAALASFADQVEQALSMIDVESRRMLEWLEHDRPRYWRTQIRMASDEVTEARAALHRCLMYPVSDEKPSCHEERAALRKAEARLAHCEAKAERLQHWKRELQHELFQYRGRISQLVRIVEADIPEAMEMVRKLLERLEQYQAVRVSGGRAAYDAAALASQLWPEQPAAEDSLLAAAPSASNQEDTDPGTISKEERDEDEGGGR